MIEQSSRSHASFFAIELYQVSSQQQAILCDKWPPSRVFRSKELQRSRRDGFVSRRESFEPDKVNYDEASEAFARDEYFLSKDVDAFHARGRVG